jgi:hypothetical protein
MAAPESDRDYEQAYHYCLNQIVNDFQSALRKSTNTNLNRRAILDHFNSLWVGIDGSTRFSNAWHQSGKKSGLVFVFVHDPVDFDLKETMALDMIVEFLMATEHLCPIFVRREVRIMDLRLNIENKNRNLMLATIHRQPDILIQKIRSYVNSELPKIKSRQTAFPIVIDVTGSLLEDSTSPGQLNQTGPAVEDVRHAAADVVTLIMAKAGQDTSDAIARIPGAVEIRLDVKARTELHQTLGQSESSLSTPSLSTH